MRRSSRENGKVKNEPLGYLSHLPESLIDIIRRSLKGERFVPVGEAFEIVPSLPRGHVQAVRSAMKRLDMASLPGGKPSRKRDLLLAMGWHCASSCHCRNWRWRVDGRARPWPLTPGRRMQMKTICARRWTGCWRVRG
ncbi:MAG: hypothetical protein LBE85_05250, partial [Candidatus Accumulibacter sp.]|nr:hypothetical protein [Accumulibacter sp.]